MSMNLFTFAGVFDVTVVRDAEFDALDYCISECEDNYLSYIENVKYIDKMNPNVVAIITTAEIAPYIPDSIRGLAISPEPKKMFVLAHNSLVEKKRRENSFQTIIGKNCQISSLAYIEPKNVIIGDNVVIEAHTVIKEGTIIEDNVYIAENCVIGGKSFNYAKTSNGEMIAIADAGTTRLCKGVEICPNCHVAKGTMASDETCLGKDVKLDAFVHVGHGSHIGQRTLITAGVKIAGNVRIGEDVWLGVSSTISNRIKIGNGAKVTLGSVVTKDVPNNQTVTGNFAIDHKKFLEHIKSIR